MSSTLRERRKDRTRTAILDALAEIVVEQGLHDFSVQDVSDRAGVSHRTVYRHFPDRNALVDALAGKLDEVFRERDLPLIPDEPEDLARRIRHVFGVFSDHRALVRAVAVGALATGNQPASRRSRDRTFRRTVEEATDGLSRREARQASAVVRYLANSLAWVVLTDQLELDEDEAAEAVTWALETLLADVRRRAEEPPGEPPGG